MTAIQTVSGDTMSSREIAELVEARHNDVLATIDRLFAKGLLRSSRITRREATGGRPLDVYDLIERDTHLVVAGYSDEHRARVIDRWQELERAKSAAPPALPQNYIAALEDLLASKKAEALAIEQRDEAIKTKALIGSKREATAMATASAAKREASALRDRLGECIDHATVTAVQNATGSRYDWLPLRRWCKAQDITPASVPDKRYGDVKSWPRAAWIDCYGVDLSKLFGEAA
jgi:phage regulator Rha-like protein